MVASNEGKWDYRIGDYARYMGVTPDLLKHYERVGLIESRPSRSGYRYYPFPTSVRLLECMRLRSYGFSLQEMKQTLGSDRAEEAMQAMDAHAELLRRRVFRDSQILMEHERLSRWMQDMQGRETVILIEKRPELWFLPHSFDRNFIEDARIQEILPEWLGWMPLVKSCQLLPLAEDGIIYEKRSWGLAIEADKAREIGLAVNDVVRRVAGGRRIVCHYCHSHAADRREPPPLRQTLEIAHKLGLQASEQAEQVVLMSLRNEKRQISCGFLALPVIE